MGVMYNDESWDAGFAAALSGSPETCPANVSDPRAYESGYQYGLEAIERRKGLPRIRKLGAVTIVDKTGDNWSDAECERWLIDALLEPVTDPEQLALNALLEEDQPYDATTFRDPIDRPHDTGHRIYFHAHWTPEEAIEEVRKQLEQQGWS